MKKLGKRFTIHKARDSRNFGKRRRHSSNQMCITVLTRKLWNRISTVTLHSKHEVQELSSVN